MTLRCIILLMLLLCVETLLAQKFSVQQFRAADGLKTDMVKCVAQDSLGFVWLGTDDGLVKYDGVKFEHYTEASTSPYIKDFLYTSDHRLLMIHDLGLVEIENRVDTVLFHNILEAGRSQTENSLWYPKSLYEDQHGGIWFSEPLSVARYHEGKLQKFRFGPEDNSNSFVRSFSFAPLYDGRLLIASYTGNFYAYRFESNTLDTLAVKGGTFKEVSSLYEFNHEILVGSTNFDRIYVEDNIVYKNEIFKDFNVSDIQPINETQLITTSFTQEAYRIDLVEGKYQKTIIPETEINMNQVYLDQDSTIWMASEKGVFIFKEYLFKYIDFGLPNMYVEDIEISPELNKAYVVIKEVIWEVDLESLAVKTKYNEKGSYFLAAELIEDHLWATNTFQVWEFKGDEVIYKIDFSEYGRFVFDLYKDINGKIWFSQEASVGTKTIDPQSYELTFYGKEQGLPYVTAAIVGNSKGVYVATEDKDNYLYFKPHNSEVFQNISHPLPKEAKSGLDIIDLEVKGDEVWLATQYGIFKHSSSELTQLKFNSDYQDVLSREIEIEEGNVWLGNTYGVFKYDPVIDEYALFTENSGLPTNNITEISFDRKRKNVWVGTPSGVAIGKSIIEKESEPVKPSTILSFKVNERAVSVAQRGKIEPNALIEITFSNLTFPANTIEYRYRVKEQNQAWSTPSLSHIARFSALESGDYTFEVKSRKIGDQTWSEPTQTTFTISPPFYLTTFFFFLVIVAIVVLIAITRTFTQYYMRKQQQLLSLQVEERTAELKQIKQELEAYNEELEKRVRIRTEKLDHINATLKGTNKELLHQRAELELTLKDLKETQQKLVHSEKMASLGLLSAGVAHEINNPLNFIQGGANALDSYFKKNYQDTPPQVLRMIEIIKEGVSRASIIVKSLNHFSRQGGSDNEICDIHDIIDNCFIMLHNKTKHKVEVVKQYEPETFFVVGNEGKLHQALLNIFTNAVQAIEDKGCITIQTKVVLDKIKILVKDSGTGIRKEDLLKIKDPFFTTKDPGKGTGLGLSITQNILEEHKGTIGFYSTLGQGTTVTIDLPIKKRKHE